MSAQPHSRFHHALKVVEERCIGCTHCMKVCPTEAIRVREGLAVITDERCVDCGNCCKACPVSAIVIEQDDFRNIFEFPVRIALIPSVLIGQFPSKVETGKIFGALKETGFTHVVEIDSVVEMVQQGYDRYLRTNGNPSPAISAFCPAIVRLIQVRFPSLTGNLIPVKPPSDVAAIYYRGLMEEEGYSPGEIGIFYVTPCAAKIASIKSPVGEVDSPVNGVINMEYLYNRLLQLIHGRDDLPLAEPDSAPLSPKGVRWSLTRGERNHQQGRCLAVDGMANVTQFLERLEESEDTGIDFLELRACDESCAGGVLISGNRFLTVERLNGRAEGLEPGRKESAGRGLFDPEVHTLGSIEPRSMLVLDSDRERAIEKVNKMEELLKVLPGIDCAACGSPSCRALAEDIVQDQAETGNCVFIQELYLRDGRMTLDQADRINAGIWGKDRNSRSQRK